METIQRIENERVTESPQLVERMDSAIGEASTSIGMIMSEMVRRSLRGGVADIGSSIHDYAREQVDAAIDEMMPTVSNAVEEIAETTSHRITDEAVQKFGDELRTVETRTVEQTQVITARYREESETALAVMKIAVTESRDAAEATARDLKDMRQRARDTLKKVQSDIQTTNDVCAEFERRLSETSQELTAVGGQLAQERIQHQETRGKLEQLERTLTAARGELKRCAQELSETRQEQSGTVETVSQLGLGTARKDQALEMLCAGLASRLDELERPRGIKALFSKFTGGKKTAKPQLPGPNIGTDSEDSAG